MRRGGTAAIGILTVALAGSCVAPDLPGIAATPPLHPSPPLVPAPAVPPVVTMDGIAVSGDVQQGALLHGQLAQGLLNLTLDGQPVQVASDGRFIIGFSRDAPTSAVLRATAPDGHAVELPLAVAPRAWHTETVGSIPRFAQPSAEFARLRPAELVQINAARHVDAVSQGWGQAFQWPVTGRISGLFGSQRVYANGEKGDPHSGVDIARPAGTPVVAPADGMVALAADHPFTLEGNLLMIDHGMGLNSAFLHLSRIDVKVGDRVRQGQPVGAVGMTGRASGPHLHWAMKWRDRRIDPLLVAGPMPPAS